MKVLRVLGIETSCDETAASIIEIDDSARTVRVLGDAVHSQIDLHAPHGGVFPMLAKREHQLNLVPVLAKALAQAGYEGGESGARVIPASVDEVLAREPELLAVFGPFIARMPKPDIDLIAVTVGPGLEPALWVGINFARALGLAWGIPVVPCNHMEGHILAGIMRPSAGSAKTYDIAEAPLPSLSLLISGGHTQIVLVEGIGSYRIIGDTRDDAVGECFDKAARTLGLAYPGGPKISRIAAEARAESIESPEILPRPMMGTDDLDFSFSGLKTAVLYLVNRLKADGSFDDRAIRGICREIEDAVTDVIVAKMRAAIERHGAHSIVVGGGVIANARIREALEALAKDCSIPIFLPQTAHATDNAFMIALAGYFNASKAVPADTALVARGTLPIGPRA